MATETIVLPKPKLWQPQKLVPWIAPLVAAAAVLLIPAPHALAGKPWVFLALFVAVIVGLVLEPLPGAAVGLLGVTIAAVGGLVADSAAANTAWALSGFANDTVWLIFAAYVFAEGYETTGLGRRIALLLVRSLGRSTLGLGYAVAFADLILAPFTPSNTARSGGTIFPIVANIPPLYDSAPGPSARRIGSYLMWVAFAATCITSSLFVTALAPNLLTMSIFGKLSHIKISWSDWFLGIAPLGIVLLLLVPLLTYIVYPPTIKRGDDVANWAGAELGRLGKASTHEYLMAGLAVAALALWIFGGAFIGATVVALAVVCAMLVSGIISWKQLIGNSSGWSVFIWFATLVALADGLAKTGLLGAFGTAIGAVLGHVSPLVAIGIAVVAFFAIHYAFASLTAQASALYPVFLTALIAVPGVNPVVAALALAYALGFMGIVTPYACGPAPIYAGSGYITTRDFWRLGSMFGALALAGLLLVTIPTLMFLHH
jgi:L-tartrate/succinate antiporter